MLVRLLAVLFVFEEVLAGDAFAEEYNLTFPLQKNFLQEEEAPHGSAGDGCKCLQEDTPQGEVMCYCRGSTVDEFPRNLTRGVTRLNLVSVNIRAIRPGDLQVYADSLRDLFIESVEELNEIEVDSLQGLHLLRTISIKQAPNLTHIQDEVFQCQLPNLKIIRVIQSALETVPNLQNIETKNVIHVVDLESNRINRLTAGSVKMKAEILNLDYNLIEEIDDWAFDGSEIAKLNLKGNTRLKLIGEKAFTGLKNIRKIDLSETSIQHLPTNGLAEIEELKLFDVQLLKVFPSVYHFKYIKKAKLTYPYHCCAFRFPASHDPDEFSRQAAFKAKMEKKYCLPGGNLYSMTNESKTVDPFLILKSIMKRSHSEWGGIHVTEDTPVFGYPINIDSGSHERQYSTFEEKFHAIFHNISNEGELFHEGNFGTKSSIDRLGLDKTFGGVFHRTTISVDKEKELQAFCGRLSKNYRDVVCTPSPDAFNPCEDVMGNTLLRVVVWFVVITAVLGNLSVMAVLMSTGVRRSVSKYLMCNLAFADFCMGIYLSMIAAMDLLSKGTYFNYAIDWQTGYGCQVAGFLTVFATELSIFTLTVISVERWYAITYAIHLNKRLDMSAAIRIMFFGWTFALTMAILPLFGINGYTRTSICLPMENRKTKDYVYLLILLTTNSFAFVFILYCYGCMYSSVIRHQSKATASDMAVAKRMALLVLTDFLCWAPVSFFAVTAVAGYPLIDVTESKILLVFFYPLNSCANPFLYAILTTQYRRDFLMLLKRCDCFNYWTRKHSNSTASCNIAGLQFSNSKRFRCSYSSDNSMKVLRPSDLSIDVSSSSARNGPFDIPEMGTDDVIKLWTVRNKIHGDYISNSSISEDSSSCMRGVSSNSSTSHKGSPHPVKNRYVHDIVKVRELKGFRTTNI